MTPEEARKWILKWKVYQVCANDYGDCNWPDCGCCEPEDRPYGQFTIQPYVEEIRNEFQKMVDEGYFELVPYYIPTEKAIREKEENEK